MKVKKDIKIYSLGSNIYKFIETTRDARTGRAIL